MKENIYADENKLEVRFVVDNTTDEHVNVIDQNEGIEYHYLFIYLFIYLIYFFSLYIFFYFFIFLILISQYFVFL
jgi:hypothetical protein